MQEIELGFVQLIEGQLDLVAEAQLFLHEGQARKGPQHGLDVCPLDLQLHAYHSP